MRVQPDQALFCERPACMPQAVPSWFVRVTAFKDRLIAANAGTHWVPRAVKEGRFAGCAPAKP